MDNKFHLKRKKQVKWILPLDSNLYDSSYPLKASDTSFLLMPDIPIAYFFPVQINANVLEKALQVTLNDYPILSGRLKIKPEGLVVAFLSESRGVKLELWKTKRDIPNLSKGSICWNEFFPKDYARFYSEAINRPLLSVKMTYFDYGKSILSFSFVHCISDGATIANFLHTLSYNCGQIQGISSIPTEKPPKPVINREYQFDQTELNKVTPEILRSSSIGHLSIIKALQFYALTTKSYFFDKVLDFSLKKVDLKKMKEQASQNLLEGEWVSSYEVLVAVMLKILSCTDEKTNPRLKFKEYSFRCLVNTRGRGAVYPPWYVGNAICLIDMTITPECRNNSNWLAQISNHVHKSLRSGLKDTKMLDKSHLYLEKGRLLDGMKGSQYRRGIWAKEWAACHFDNNPVCNSWLDHDWFDLDFGNGGTLPTAFRVPKSFTYRRHMFVTPRNKDEINLRIQLQPKMAKQFIASISLLGLPFQLREG